MYAIFTSSTNGFEPAICYAIELVVGRPNQPSAEGDLPIQYVVAGTRFPPCLSRSSSFAVSIKGCPADVPELPFQRLQTSVCIRSPCLNPCWNMCVQENIQGLLPTEFRSSDYYVWKAAVKDYEWRNSKEGHHALSGHEE
jgi:hypothetical protein